MLDASAIHVVLRPADHILIEKADQALYEAKKAGRNRCVTGAPQLS